MPQLNGIKTIWAFKLFPREESKPVFTSRSVIDNHSSSSSI